MDVTFGSHAAWVDVTQAVTAILSICLAAWAAFYATKEARRNQLSAEFNLSPAIYFVRSRAELDGISGLKVSSVGNGLAVIDKVYLLYKGKAYLAAAWEPWTDNLQKSIEQDYPKTAKGWNAFYFSAMGFLPGEAMGVGTEEWVIRFHKVDAATPQENIEQLLQFHEFLANCKLAIFYRSVHGRYFNNLDPYNAEGNMPSSITAEAWIENHLKQKPEGLSQ